MSKKYIFFFMTILLLIPAAGYGAGVRAVVDKTEMTLEDGLTLMVVIENGTADVDTSVIRDFKIVSDETSSNIQWINGKTISEFRHIYELVPLKKGELTIPPLAVTKGRKTWYTKSIAIHVTDTPATGSADRDVFVRAAVSNPSPYVGEPVVYTFSLYTGVRITNAGLQRPEFHGFDAKEIEGEKTRKTVISGREYIVTEVETVLLPLKGGETVIEPSALTCDVVYRDRRRRHSDPFDSFFNDSFFGSSRLKRKVLRTDSVELKVKSLPPCNLDVKYSGLVGKVDLTAEIENRQIKAGDSTTLTVTIEGYGNIMDVEAPEVVVPDGFKSYRDNPEEAITPGKKGYHGKKVFRRALVAVNPGSYTVGPVKLAYFDVEKKRYEVVSSGPFNIEVMGSGIEKPEDAGGEAESKPGILKKKVEYTGHDILPLKEGLDATLDRNIMSFKTYMAWLFIPVLLAGAVKITVSLRNKEAGISSVMAKRAENALKEAARKNISTEEFLASLYRAFVSSIFAKAAVSGETLTTAEAKKVLASRGCAPEMVEAAADLLVKIESARFGGHTPDEGFRKALLSDTREMVRRIL